MRILLISIALFGGASAAAEARLLTQRIGGGNRVCVYEIRGLPGRAMVRETKVGMGEPCPARYRAPRAAPDRRIPADARLESTRRIGGRTICTYARFGRRYSHAVSLSAACPPIAGAID